MQYSTQSHLRPVPHSGESPTPVTGDSSEAATVGAKEQRPRRRLGPLHCLGAFLIFALWLVLFGVGIMVDTTPYRRVISTEGAQRLQAEGQSTAAGDSVENKPQPSAASEKIPKTPPGLAQSWFVVLFCFLPLNLAWLCVCASTLGGVGNLAHLGADGSANGGRDASNPVLSAVLRGFFVYLFLMSGLLLLDHAPFSNAGPSQYIRLAGFLSLFSFVVSYHPELFGALIMSAFERIQVRAQHDNGGSPPTVQQHTAIRTTVESTSAVSGPAEIGSLKGTAQSQGT
jgi:hypothetical protein